MVYNPGLELMCEIFHDMLPLSTKNSECIYFPSLRDKFSVTAADILIHRRWVSEVQGQIIGVPFPGPLRLKPQSRLG